MYTGYFFSYSNRFTKLLLAGFMLAAGVAGAQPQIAADWFAAFGGTGIDIARAITTDDRYVYVTGVFAGTADFDPGPGTDYLTAEGDLDIFFAKFTKDGEYLWARSLGGPFEDRAESITTDGDGHIYLTGYYTAIADFDPGPATAHLHAAGGRDVFIAGYDTAGNYIWANTAGGDGEDMGTSITATASGNLYITGKFHKEAAFGQGPVLTAPFSGIFVAAYTNGGAHIWSFSIAGGQGHHSGNAIATDSNEDVYVTGAFSDTADFDPGTGTALLANTPLNSCTFLARYDRNGNYIWARHMPSGPAGGNGGSAVKADQWGNTYVTGVFYDTIWLSPANQTSYLLAAAGRNLSEIFLAKYDASGSCLWVSGMGGPRHDICEALALDETGNPYITGRYSVRADFDPGPDTAYLYGDPGYSNVFVAAYDTAGIFRWAKKIGGTGNDWGMAISADSSGVYAGGTFERLLRLDSRPDLGTFTSAGQQDMFLLRLNCAEAPRSFTIVTCASFYNFEGRTYTQGGLFTHRYKDPTGCLHSVTLELTLHDIPEPEIRADGNVLSVAEVYDSYHWLHNGILLPDAQSDTLHVTENGDYQVVVSTDEGCRDTSGIYAVNNLRLSDYAPPRPLIHPNPTDGILGISSPVPLRAQLVSACGKPLINTRIHNGCIDITSYPAGFYMLLLSDEEGRPAGRHKIVKQ